MKRMTFALLLAAACAGCSRSEPEAVPETNEVIERATPSAAASPSATLEAAPATEPTAGANTTAAAPPPPEEVGADEQMLDDASATGMTARAERDEAESAEPLPANSEEQQAEPQ